MSALTSLLSPSAPTKWPLPDLTGPKQLTVQLPFRQHSAATAKSMEEVLIEAERGCVELTLTPKTFEAAGRTGFAVTGFPGDDADHVAFVVQPPAHPSKEDPMHELSDNSVSKRAEALSGMILLDQSPQQQQHGGLLLFLLSNLYFNTLYKGEENVLLSTGVPPIKFLAEAITASGDLSEGFVLPSSQTDKATWHLLPRADFWQFSPPADRLSLRTLSPWTMIDAARWHAAGGYTRNAPRGTVRNAHLKPVEGQVVYSRYFPELNEHLSFQMISGVDGGADVARFAKWQNSDRVNSGWRQRSSDMAEHETFVQDCIRAPGRWGLVGYWGKEAWGYVEIYWARESNLAPFYPSGAYDMGFHALVGEDRFRGAHRVRSWMGAAVHLCFSLDPRTQLVVSEPRASNTKMVEYECMVGGHVEKLIDLGHKRSALVMIPRERFFQLCPMGPLPQHMQQVSS